MTRSVNEPTNVRSATTSEHAKHADSLLDGDTRSLTWFVLALLVLGGALRFYQLGAKGLWGDEIWTAQWSKPPLVQVLIDQTKIPDMPLMYGLVHVSTRFGDSEFWVRLPAAIFGVIGLVAFFFLADLTLGRRTALVGAALMAISPIHIWYSQDARYYTQLSTLCIVSVAFFYSFLTADRVRLTTWLGFLLVNTAALYTHLFAGWIILAEGLFAVYFLLRQARCHDGKERQLRWQTRAKALWLLAALLLFAILTFPVMLRLVEALQSGTSSGGEGMARLQLQPTLPEFFTPTFFAEMVRYFSGGRIATLVMLPFFGVGLVATWRKKRDVAVLVLCLIITPLLTTFFLDLMHGISFKYFFFLLPFYLLLVAEGLVVTAASLGGTVGVWRQRKHPVEVDRPQQYSLLESMTRLVLLLVIVLTYVRPLTILYDQAKVNDWRAIAAYLANKVQPEDIVLAERWGAEALRYYLPPTGDITVLTLNPERWQRMRHLGAQIWLIGLDDEYEQQAGDSLQKVDDSEWQDARWIYDRSPEHDIYYPITEPTANIFVDATMENASFVDFMDIDNAGWTQETYRDVAPGRQATVLLTLEAVASRVLKIQYYDHPGKDFEVSVDGRIIGSVVGGSLGGWQTLQSQIPEQTGDSVRAIITATGQEGVGLDWAELAYDLPPTMANANQPSASDLIMDDQGVIDFTDIANAEWTTETYRHLAPGDEIRISLNNPNQAERRLIVKHFDFVGKDLQVRANGHLIGTITGSDRGVGWIEESLIVPGDLGEKVLIQVQAIGLDASGVSSLAIQPVE